MKMAIKGGMLSKSAPFLLGIKFKNSFNSCPSGVRPNHFLASSSLDTLLQLNSTSRNYLLPSALHDKVKLLPHTRKSLFLPFEAKKHYQKNYATSFIIRQHQ